MKIILTLLLFLAYFVNHALGVNAKAAVFGLPFVRHYDRTAYAAGAETWDITQDQKGLMYFANQEGLLQFDGNTWELYTLPNKTMVRSVAIDSLNRIFVGGQSEFGFFEHDSLGGLDYKSLTNLVPRQYIDFEDVWKVVITGDGVFFNSFTAIFKYTDNNIAVLTPESRFDILYQSQDEVYVIDWGHGLKQYKDGELRLISDHELFKQDGLASILTDKNEQQIYVSYNEGIFKESKNGTVTFLDSRVSDFTIANTAFRALELSNDQLAIGTSNDGLIVADKEHNIIHHLTKGKGLTNREILCMFQDAYGDLWVGHRDGISLIELNSPFSLIDDQLGLEGSGYTSLVSNEVLYLGTNLGVYAINLNNEPNTSTIDFVGGSEGHSYTLQEYNSSLLLGQHNGSYTISANKADRFSSINGIWTFDRITSNLLLVGTYQGLLIAEKVNQDVWQVKSKVEGFSESSRFLVSDNGLYWVAHPYKGLYSFELSSSNNAVINLEHYGADHGFPSDLNINVFDIDGQPIFTGDHGLYRFANSTNTFTPDIDISPLFSKEERIIKLTQAPDGSIWFITDKSIGQISRTSDGDYEIADIVHGKLNDRLTYGFEHIGFINSSQIIFGSTDGFILYDPTFGNDAKTSFRTLITKVATPDDQLIYKGGDHHGLSGLKPEFRFRQNSLRFSYAGIFYQEPDKTTYSYYLEGFDTDWTSWRTDQEKEYTNLTEGEYTFLVKAKNIYNQESSVASYSFVILPPWYRTVWAYGCLIIAVFGGLFFAFARVKVRHEREKKTIEEQQAITLKEKQSEYEAETYRKEQEIIKLRNEKLEAEVVHKNQELAVSTMSIIQKNEALGQIRLKLLSIAGKVRSKATKSEVESLVKAVEKDINPDIDWKQFEIHFDKAHEDYLKRLRDRYPNLTHSDLKICSYLRMGLSTKEISILLNNSIRGVETARYRVRQKLGLDTKVDLVDFLIGI